MAIKHHLSVFLKPIFWAYLLPKGVSVCLKIEYIPLNPLAHAEKIIAFIQFPMTKQRKMGASNHPTSRLWWRSDSPGLIPNGHRSCTWSTSAKARDPPRKKWSMRRQKILAVKRKRSEHGRIKKKWGTPKLSPSFLFHTFSIYILYIIFYIHIYIYIHTHISLVFQFKGFAWKHMWWSITQCSPLATWLLWRIQQIFRHTQTIMAGCISDSIAEKTCVYNLGYGVFNPRLPFGVEGNLLSKRQMGEMIPLDPVDGPVKPHLDMGQNRAPPILYTWKVNQK